MLTSEHAIVEYKQGAAVADRLVTGRHGHYVEYARRMLEVYRQGIGSQRRELHGRVEAVFRDEADCPRRRIQAFCRLLDDASVYQTDARGEAARLRLRVFALAADRHPLVTEPDRLFEHSEQQVKAEIAAELEKPWPEIEAALYADVIAFQRLESFNGYADEQALLSRYNVAQLQACLYRAESAIVEATEDFQTILRYAKLARLLHEVEALGASRYRIALTGPASILRRTRSYGVNLARFLPALLACKGWSFTAALQTPWSAGVRLRLSAGDGFKSHLPPAEEFDSSVEESFAAKFGPERDGWRLKREGGILHAGQSAFVPDFVLGHEDGTEIFLEIVGFWTPEYLAAKRRTLQRFRDQRILIAVPQRSLRPGAAAGDNVIVYKTSLKVSPVLEALEKLRARENGSQAASRNGKPGVPADS